MENCQFVKDCIALKVDESIQLPTLSFDELFNLKYPAESKEDPMQLFLFSKFRITAETATDNEMRRWNGKDSSKDENFIRHICPAGTTVLVWMVSRFGDVGITDILVDAVGYDTRIDQNTLINWVITRKED
jgi:hypothetical protein